MLLLELNDFVERMTSKLVLCDFDIINIHMNYILHSIQADCAASFVCESSDLYACSSSMQTASKSFDTYNM